MAGRRTLTPSTAVRAVRLRGTRLSVPAPSNGRMCLGGIGRDGRSRYADASEDELRSDASRSAAPRALGTVDRLELLEAPSGTTATQ